MLFRAIALIAAAASVNGQSAVAEPTAGGAAAVETEAVDAEPRPSSLRGGDLSPTTPRKLPGTAGCSVGFVRGGTELTIDVTPLDENESSGFEVHDVCNPGRSVAKFLAIPPRQRFFSNPPPPPIREAVRSFRNGGVRQHIALPDLETCGHDVVDKADYRGDISETAEGDACLPWTVSNDYTPEFYPSAGLEGGHNHCRNPNNGWEGPWCYTDAFREQARERAPMDPRLWCDIPSCSTRVEATVCIPASQLRIVFHNCEYTLRDPFGSSNTIEGSTEGEGELALLVSPTAIARWVTPPAIFRADSSSAATYCPP